MKYELCELRRSLGHGAVGEEVPLEGWLALARRRAARPVPLGPRVVAARDAVARHPGVRFVVVCIARTGHYAARSAEVTGRAQLEDGDVPLGRQHLARIPLGDGDRLGATVLHVSIVPDLALCALGGCIGGRVLWEAGLLWAWRV